MRKKTKNILFIAIVLVLGIPVVLWVLAKVLLFGYTMFIAMIMYAKIDMYPARIVNDTQEQIYVCSHRYPEGTNEWYRLRPKLDCEVIDPGDYADYGASDMYFGYYSEHTLPKDEEVDETTENLGNYCLGSKYKYSEEEIKKQDEEFWRDIASSKEMTPWEELKYNVNVFGQYKEMNIILSRTMEDLDLSSYYNWSEAIEFEPGDMTPSQVRAECDLLRAKLYGTADKEIAEGGFVRDEVNFHDLIPEEVKLKAYNFIDYAYEDTEYDPEEIKTIASRRLEYLRDQDVDYNYPIAGVILADVLAQTNVSEEEIGKEFADNIARYIAANTPDMNITDPVKRYKDMFDRVENAGGQGARTILAVKMYDLVYNEIPSAPKDEQDFLMTMVKDFLDQFNNKIGTYYGDLYIEYIRLQNELMN